MPFLEQQRRPRRDGAGTVLLRLIRSLLDNARRHWPPAWALVFVLASALGPRLPHAAPVPAACAAWAAVAAPLLLAVGGRRIQAAAWLVTIAGAVLWGQALHRERLARPAAAAEAPWSPASRLTWRAPAVLRTTGFAGERSNGGWRAPACVLAAGEPPGGGPVAGDGAWLAGQGDEPPPGAVLRGVVAFTRPEPAAVPGGFDLQAFLAGRALTWRADGDEHLAPRPSSAGAGALLARHRAILARRLDALLPPREAGVALAALLGVRTAASREAAAPFAALGLAHLFALSGLHVGILAGLLLAPASLAGAGRGARAVVATLVLGAYAALTGAPGSVVRAGAVVAATMTVAASGRRGGALRLLGLVFWATAAWQPRLTLDAGLRLSYAAAAGVVAAHGLTGGFRVGGPAPVRAAAAGLGVTLAAQWATLPLAAASFGTVNAFAPLANLVAVPVFGAAIWLIALALAAAGPAAPLGQALAAWGWLLLRLLEAGAAWLAPRAAPAAIGLPPPGPVPVVAWLGAGALLAALLRRRPVGWTARLGVPLVLLGGLGLLGPAARALPPRGAPVAVQFAVGQGDCGLVVFPDGWTALVDLADARPGRPGAFARDVAPWLRRQGVRRFDLVVLTHGHRDHTGGAAELVGAFAVERWAAGGRAAEAVDAADASGAFVRTGRAPVIVHRWSEWTLEVVDPGPALGPGADENDRSLAVVLRRDGVPAMLWTGDLETAGERALVACGGLGGGAPVWKAGHHGSDTSGSQAFLEAATPGAVIVSCGVDNRYRHPSHGPWTVGRDTLGVVRTDLQGTVTVSWKGGEARIRAGRSGPP